MGLVESVVRRRVRFGFQFARGWFLIKSPMADLKSEPQIPAKAPAEPAPKAEAKPSPAPWPICLTVLVPLVFGGILLWKWTHEDWSALIRFAWIGLCSVVPGLLVMAVLGSLAQMRRRPFLSVLSLLLSGGMLGACAWAIQYISANAESWLR